MINRREALKSLAFIPILGKSGSSASAVQLGTKHFLLFFDNQACDVSDLINLETPEGLQGPEVVIYYVPLKLRFEQTIEDAVRLYEVDSGVRS